MPDSNTIRVRAGDGAEADLHISRAADTRFGLLWLPALGVTARHYLRLAETLAKRGVNVAVHEWRGAGSSNLRASRQCDWGYRELLEHDIPASFDAARSALPDMRWVSAGHSIGGQFACLHAATNPGASAAIAMVASGSPYWKTFPANKQWLMRMVPPIVDVVTAVCGYYPGKRIGFAGTEARTLMRDWAQSARTGHYSAYIENVDYERSMREFAKPVLNIRLADDALCPTESCEWLLGKFPGIDAQRASLSASEFESGQASHFSWLKEPGPIAQRIANWIQQQFEVDGASQHAGKH